MWYRRAIKIEGSAKSREWRRVWRVLRERVQVKAERQAAGEKGCWKKNTAQKTDMAGKL
jgi:hypothetical protein